MGRRRRQNPLPQPPPKKVPGWKSLLELSQEELATKHEIVKIEISNLCQAMLSEPEKALISPPNDINKLRVLLKLMDLKYFPLKRLVILSLVAVFNDLLPNYNIISDHYAAEMQSIQLKKEVKKRYKYEMELNSCYQVFLSYLLSLKSKQYKSTQILCICTLLKFKGKWHFRTKLLILLVQYLLKASNTSEVMLNECKSCLVSLFKNDPNLEISLEAIAIASKKLKKISIANVSTQFLEALMQLSISNNVVTDVKFKPKKKKEKLVGASLLKDRYEKDSNQNELLRELFLIYFKILQSLLEDPEAAPHKNMFWLLKGITKYIHHINMDIVKALLQSFLSLLKLDDLNLADKILVISTSFTILKYYGKQIKFDDNQIIHWLLQCIDNLKYDMQSLDSDVMVNLLKAIEFSFLNSKPNVESVEKLCKLLNEVYVHLRVNEAMCFMMIIKQLSFKYDIRDLEDLLWNMSIFQFSYHPGMRTESKQILNDIKGKKVENCLNVNRPFAMYKKYDSSRGGFYPKVQNTLSSKKPTSVSFKSKRGLIDSLLARKKLKPSLPFSN